MRLVRNRSAAFAGSALLSTVAMSALNVQAANFVLGPPSACQIISDGTPQHVGPNAIGTNDQWVGRPGGTSSSSGMKLYCPVVETSNLLVSNSSLVDHVTVQSYNFSVTQPVVSQLCVDFQSSIGGFCDNSFNSAVGGGNSWSNIPISTAWQSHPTDYKYIFVYIPPQGGSDFAGYLEGWTIWHG